MATTKEKSVTNPNGANKWVTDPRQQLFLAYWKDPLSETFSDVKNSAIRAGYAEEYADNLTSILPEWLLVSMGQINPLLALAERNLKEFLELPSETQVIGMHGPVFEKIISMEEVGKKKNGEPKMRKKVTKVPVIALNPKVMKIKQDTSHFVAETIGKKNYSKKEGNEGDVYNTIIFANEQQSKIAKRILGGGSVSDQ